MRLALAAAMVLACGVAAAQVAGQVESARGVGFAQAPGEVPRTLGTGLPLREGDRLTTAEGASAIIKLEDGTRMTVRPNSELVLQQYSYRENAPAGNSMLMQLVRGGFRAVTGLIAKASPNAARVQTSTATIGIRGTDFDARLCARDCGGESARIAEAPRPNAPVASARVVQLQGPLSAVDAAGQRRRLAEGAAVYPGDLVETEAGTRAVLAFRDESRLTLGASTRFRIDNFVYDERNAGEGRFLVSILKGTVRALTGLIAKANNRNVGFATSTATIGVRGTGLDISCTGACAGEPGGPDTGLTVFTWLGSIVVSPTGQTALQALLEGQGLFISPSGIRLLNSPPPMDGPRPDGVNVPGNLFSTEGINDLNEGLFVFVRDGHIEIATATQILHLGKNEAGFAGADGGTGRPPFIPKFIEFDPIPPPGSPNWLRLSLAGNTCR
ncbi:MAG TPA: FecR domain-containing protein [Ramlibacter sp.]|nr:FecR domain-containing protein [Ramlibacter sp.]